MGGSWSPIDIALSFATGGLYALGKLAFEGSGIGAFLGFIIDGGFTFFIFLGQVATVNFFGTGDLGATWNNILNKTLKPIMSFIGIEGEEVCIVGLQSSKVFQKTYAETAKIELIISKVKYGFSGSDYIKSYQTRGDVQLRRYKIFGENYYIDHLPEVMLTGATDRGTLKYYDEASEKVTDNPTGRANIISRNLVYLVLQMMELYHLYMVLLLLL